MVPVLYDTRYTLILYTVWSGARGERGVPEVPAGYIVYPITICTLLPHFFQRHLSNHFLSHRFVSLLVRLSEQLFRK